MVKNKSDYLNNFLIFKNINIFKIDLNAWGSTLSRIIVFHIVLKIFMTFHDKLNAFKTCIKIPSDNWILCDVSTCTVTFSDFRWASTVYFTPGWHAVTLLRFVTLWEVFRGLPVLNILRSNEVNCSTSAKNLLIEFF